MANRQFPISNEELPKSRNSTLLSPRAGHHHSKSYAGGFAINTTVEARDRAAGLCPLAPTAAARHPKGLIAPTLPRAPVRRRVEVVRVPDVQTPLIHIAMHIV